MRNVKMVKAWANYGPGGWAAVEDKVAENLINQGIAIDPTRPKPEPALPKDTANNTSTTFAKIARVPKPKAAKKKAKRRARL